MTARFLGFDLERDRIALFCRQAVETIVERVCGVVGQILQSSQGQYRKSTSLPWARKSDNTILQRPSVDFSHGDEWSTTLGGPQMVEHRGELEAR
jgi:hypothetical protein